MALVSTKSDGNSLRYRPKTEMRYSRFGLSLAWGTKTKIVAGNMTFPTQTTINNPIVPPERRIDGDED